MSSRTLCLGKGVKIVARKGLLSHSEPLRDIKIKKHQTIPEATPTTWHITQLFAILRYNTSMAEYNKFIRHHRHS